MKTKSFIRVIILPCLVALLLFLLGYLYQEPLWRFYAFVSDREAIKIFIQSYGSRAPLAFILIQILQVVAAPIPGEATGFVGGYLFGAALGFLYSTIGLGVGSGINFFIGRLAGVNLIRKIISPKTMNRFDTFFKKQGTLLLLILYIFPGFPKDILSILAGITSIPFKIFILIATIGRMPGTLFLSLQGEFLYQKNYEVLVVSIGLCLILSLICIRYRENIYLWLDK